MRSIRNIIIIESSLFILLIGWLIILLMCSNTIPVNGLDSIKAIFTNTSSDNYRRYGLICLFSCFGIALTYAMFMVLMYFFRIDRKIVYGFNLTFYSLSASAMVVGLLLLFLNF